MTRHTATALTSMPTELPMLESGTRINSMEKELKNGQTAPSTKELIWTEKSMETAA